MSGRPVRDDNLRFVLLSYETGYMEAGLVEACAGASVDLRGAL